VINPWLEDDQVDEVVKQLTTNFPSTNLLQNNRHVFNQLLENTSVSENRKTGEKSPSVKFIDFKNRDNNRFIAVCQFKVRILGTEHHIIPDIVLFLNGLPVVVIECKSPKVKEPIPEAIDQLLRYSEQRGAKGEGGAPLFFYNQFVVTTCRQEAKFGTITTHNEKHFYRWSDPFPRTLNDLDHGSSSPNDGLVRDAPATAGIYHLPRLERISRVAAAMSGACSRADTTTMRRAPAASTCGSVAGMIPPMQNAGI